MATGIGLRRRASTMQRSLVLQGSIAPYFHNAAPDTKTIVPPGIYTVTGLDIDEMVQPVATGGLYNGWRIVMAPTPGSVIIDPTGWNLAGPIDDLQDLRMIFGGFHYLNGLQVMEWCRHFYHWWCSGEFPWYEWRDQYAAHNGGTPPVRYAELDAGVLASMDNFTPSIWRWGSCTGCGDIACTLAHVGDDIIFANNSGTARYSIGRMGWDVAHHDRQYFNPAAPTETAQHPDGDQTRSDGGVHMLDFWLPNHQFSTEGGDQDIEMKRGWVAGGNGTSTFADGAFEDPPSPKILVGEMEDVIYFCCAQAIDPDFETEQPQGPGKCYPFVEQPFSPTDEGWGLPSDQVGNVGSTFPNQRGVGWTWGIDDEGTLPAGITATDRVLDDILNAEDGSVYYNLDSLKNHVDNPARLFRNATGNAYNDVDVYFSSTGNFPLTLWT